jgi:Na+/pantothenate symporter
VPAEKRSTGFGVFDTGVGVASFVGGATMGWLYGKSLVALVIFSLVLQFAALPVLVLGGRAAKQAAPGRTAAD